MLSSEGAVGHEGLFFSSTTFTGCWLLEVVVVPAPVFVFVVVIQGVVVLLLNKVDEWPAVLTKTESGQTLSSSSETWRVVFVVPLIRLDNRSLFVTTPSRICSGRQTHTHTHTRTTLDDGVIRLASCAALPVSMCVYSYLLST